MKVKPGQIRSAFIVEPVKEFFDRIVGRQIEVRESRSDGDYKRKRRPGGGGGGDDSFQQGK